MRASWDEMWLNAAITVGTRSACVRRQIGCIIVDSGNRILSTGYNGPPARFEVAGPCTNYCERSKNVLDLHGYTDCVALHAEANCLAYTDPVRAVNGTAYVNGYPCVSCAKLLAGAGLDRVVVPVETPVIDQADQFMASCNMKVVRYAL